jgi:hypothetical protein
MWVMMQCHKETPCVNSLNRMPFFSRNGEEEGKTGPVLAPVGGGGHQERAQEGEWGGILRTHE